MKWFNAVLLTFATLTGAGLYHILASRQNDASLKRPSRPPSCEAPPGTNTSLDRDVGQLAVQIADLRRELAALRTEFASRREVNPAATDGEPQEALTAGNSPKVESEEDWLVERREVMANLQEEFSKEQGNAGWSSTMALSIKDSADKYAAIKKSVREIDCRSTTCRVELAIDATQDLQRELEPFTMSLASALPQIIFDHATDPHGQKLLVLYLTNPRDS